MKIKVASFNLFQFCAPPYSWYIKKDKFTSEQWDKKTNWIKEQIEKMDCDIIGFQEVFSKDELEKICKELGYNYFVMVDEAKKDKINSNVYISTTVALASKYPILKIEEVKPHIQSLKKHFFNEKFDFSRKPIKALIEIEHKKEIFIYVNHFKSNRLNEFEYIFNKETSLSEKKQKVFTSLKNKNLSALKQRLCETSSLYYDFLNCDKPIICLCDLNDKEFSLSIDALTNSSYHNERKKFNSYLLYDAYNLASKKQSNPHPEKKNLRKATSYYLSKGNVIDYIFVSKDFNKKDKNAIGKINSYEVLDNHLKDNKNGSLLQSDHAPVVCEISFSEI